MHPLDVLLREYELTLSHFLFLNSLLSNDSLFDPPTDEELGYLLQCHMIKRQGHRYILTGYGQAIIEVINTLKA